jgi:hypothetical protein
LEDERRSLEVSRETKLLRFFLTIINLKRSKSDKDERIEAILAFLAQLVFSYSSATLALAKTR